MRSVTHCEAVRTRMKGSTQSKTHQIGFVVSVKKRWDYENGYNHKEKDNTSTRTSVSTFSKSVTFC